MDELLVAAEFKELGDALQWIRQHIRFVPVLPCPLVTQGEAETPKVLAMFFAPTCLMTLRSMSFESMAVRRIVRERRQSDKP